MQPLFYSFFFSFFFLSFFLILNYLYQHSIVKELFHYADVSNSVVL